ncbi:MAG TPA: hypothetical protein VF723_10125 [Pyrinomonadaceae bacterium]|jgi:hypothetical protein
MNESRAEGARGLSWQTLAPPVRQLLEGRLEGLYAAQTDREAFDALAIDKQQALLIFAGRLLELGLWAGVRRIENVYGTGGVGMAFTARPFLRRALAESRDFSGRFARHRATAGGFVERRRGRASLHLLYVDEGASRWTAHFDLYNPRVSARNAWLHLLHEKVGGRRPGWQAIGVALGYVRESLVACV